jgi:TPR repeat protein
VANQNNSTAIYNLGIVYCNGEGVEKNYSKAIEYFKIASGKGDSDAQNLLGIMYTNAQETEKGIDSILFLYKGLLKP